jgi:hypothetical protein
MTVTKSTRSPVSQARRPVATSAGRSYRRAHWFMLASLAVVVAGFWPSFFRDVGAHDPAHTIHGVAASLWIAILALQSWLMSRGYVAWHHRVARAAFVLLPVLCLSALDMVRLMLANPEMPQGLAVLLAFIDIPSVLFLATLFVLALANIRTPAAHKRFMSATVLPAFPPALTRLYARELPIGFSTALQLSFVTVEVILLCLLINDWRNGERRLAYPLSLAFFVLVHVLMGFASRNVVWVSFTGWYAALF